MTKSKITDAVIEAARDLHAAGVIDNKELLNILQESVPGTVTSPARFKPTASQLKVVSARCAELLANMDGDALGEFVEDDMSDGGHEQTLCSRASNVRYVIRVRHTASEFHLQKRPIYPKFCWSILARGLSRGPDFLIF